MAIIDSYEFYEDLPVEPPPSDVIRCMLVLPVIWALLRGDAQEVEWHVLKDRKSSPISLLSDPIAVSKFSVYNLDDVLVTDFFSKDIGEFLADYVGLGVMRQDIKKVLAIKSVNRMTFEELPSRASKIFEVFDRRFDNWKEDGTLV